MCHNCFTYTFTRLKATGFVLPTVFEGFEADDLRYFIKEQQFFLDNKVHYRYFESFCKYVDEAIENDIIIDDFGIGVAINKYKYMTIKDSNRRSTLCDISKGQKILRIING